MITKLTLSEQIYADLREKIVTGKIPLGEKLVNRQLQEEYGVSSSPIRDAINRLHMDGLVSEITNAGATIIDLEYGSVDELNEIVKSIFFTGILLSLKKANTEDILDKANEIIKLQEKYIEDELYYKYDYDYHKLFIDYSDNRYLKKLFKEYSALNELLFRNLIGRAYANFRKDSIGYHKTIIEEFKNKDIPRIQAAVDIHYEKPLNFLANHLK